MFRIKKRTASNRTIRMDDSLIRKLEHVAGLHDISFNSLVSQCCEYALNNLNMEERDSFPAE